MSGPGKSNKTAAPQTSPQEKRARAPAHLAVTLAATPRGQLAETIRTSPVMQARTAAVKSAFGSALDPKPNRTGLPDALKSGVEAASGLSMDDVRVFRNSAKPARLQALAYARGTEIHLGPGQEKHLPHEAWHVVQQKQGRVKPTLQMKGVAINDDGGLEREADASSRGALRIVNSGSSWSSVAAPAANPPVQRKLRVAVSDTIYETAKAASEAVPASASANWNRLDKATAAAAVYTVKTVDALKELAEGNQADVLLPSKHVIGENHKFSEFEKIKNEWPNVPAVAEGTEKILETNLKLKQTLKFTDVMQSRNATNLPLENYHAASLARLISYLVIWNAFHKTPPAPDSKSELLGRAKDMVSIFAAYNDVAVNVYKHGMDKSYLRISPRYAGAIEEAYGGMFKFIAAEPSKSAFECFTQIETAKAKNMTPVFNGGQVEAVRTWLKDMIREVGVILTTSANVHPHDDAKAIEGEVKDASGYIAANYKTMSDMQVDMQTGLNLVNRTRERFMGEEIKVAPTPSLIKVGTAHLVGIRALGIPDVTLHADAKAFRGDLPKSASDL